MNPQTNNRYGWVQTKGPATCTAGLAAAAGDTVITSATTAGCVDPILADNVAPIVGTCLFASDANGGAGIILDIDR